MKNYKLTTPAEILNAAELAGIKADNEPNQDGYNAAWLHGYAQALYDCGKQLQAAQIPADLYKRLWLAVEDQRAAAEREITESAETLARFSDAPHDIAVGVCLKRIAKAKSDRDEAAALLADLEKIAPAGC